jgi:hypothetical protein
MSPEPARAETPADEGRGGRQTRKEILCGKVLEAMTVSLTIQSFEEHLSDNNITLYHRNGRPAGIVSGNKKYRFTTLGLDEVLRTAETRWKRISHRKRSLQNIFTEKARCFFREFGFAHDLMAVLGRGKGEGIRQKNNPQRHRRSPDGPERDR